MNYKQLLILRLSHLTEWRNIREMIIPKEMYQDCNWTETCEFFGDGKYVLRGYWKNGQPYCKREYQNNQEYGLSLGWWENGQLYWKEAWENGQRHGLSLGWWENGQLYWKTEYQNGELISGGCFRND